MRATCRLLGAARSEAHFSLEHLSFQNPWTIIVKIESCKPCDAATACDDSFSAYFCRLPAIRCSLHALCSELAVKTRDLPVRSTRKAFDKEGTPAGHITMCNYLLGDGCDTTCPRPCSAPSPLSLAFKGPPSRFRRKRLHNPRRELD